MAHKSMGQLEKSSGFFVCMHICKCIYIYIYIYLHKYKLKGSDFGMFFLLFFRNSTYLNLAYGSC